MGTDDLGVEHVRPWTLERMTDYCLLVAGVLATIMIVARTWRLSEHDAPEPIAA